MDAARSLVALLAALSLLLAGCSGTARVAAPSIEHPAELSVVRRSTGRGPDVALLSRPLGELLWLSLWLDAGSRDAEVPQAATLAAWLAAEHGGSGIEAHVEPEGTELALPCRVPELRRCAEALARALSLRAVPEAGLRRARDRLVNARRSAEAGDPAREADRLALLALFGEAAAALEPLGRPAGDEALDRASVERFLGAHYGARRALLIAVGRLDERSLIGEAERAFGAVPTAGRARAPERGAPSASGVRNEVGDAPALAFALAVGRPEDAHARCEAFIARLEQAGVARALGAHVMRLRGHALCLARLHAADPARATQALAEELARARTEPSPEPPLSARDASPRALGRQLGARWAAEPTGPRALLELGIGVLTTGGRADRTTSDDPDAPARERSAERLQAAFRAGLAAGMPEATRAETSAASSVTLDNGARIELQEARGDQLALALWWSRGGTPEPPAEHGQAALLSLLTATACAGHDPSALAARLRALGAELQPIAEPDGFGIVLTARAERWSEALELGLACALRPGLERRHLSAARLRLLEQLGGEDGHGELRAAVAELIAPATPSRVAPWGSPARQASIGLHDLRELYAQHAVGAGLRVAVVAPVARDALLATLARALADVPARPRARRGVAAAPARVALAHERRAELPQSTLGLAVWRAAGTERAGAHTFAALAHAALSREPGLHVAWHDAGLHAGEAWAAVAVTGPPERIAAAPEIVRALGASLGAAHLTSAADAACAELQTRAAATGSTPAAQAVARVLGVAPGAAELADPAPARALAQALARSSPAWLTLP